MSSDIVFAKTRHFYQSYSDYYRLVELAGYPVCYVDEIAADDASKCYIFSPLNGETQQGWPDAKASIIHLDLEYHLPAPGVEQWNVSVRPPGVSRVWIPDPWLARYHNAEYVILGSDPRLNPEPERREPKTYDVAFVGYRDVYRRQVILQQLAALGVTIAPNGWGNERHEALLRSSAYLQIHQWDNIPAISPQRWCVAAAYKLPVISEKLADNGAFGYSHMLTSEYKYLAEFVQLWTRRNDPRGLENFGLALYSFLCEEHTFRKTIERNV